MPRRPNVIVFFTDQQRHDTTGVHGNPSGLTPNFDWMARQGTHVAQSFTCQPVCGPARACLQTGRFATQTGVWKNGFRPDPSLKMLGSYFSEAGYDTAYIGKWHLVEHGHMGPVPPDGRGGYRHWLAANLVEFISGPYDTHLWDAAGREHKLPGYRIDAMTDAAIRYIAERADAPEPFFLFLSLLEPHHQNNSDNYPAPAGYEQQFLGAPLPPDLQRLGGTAPQHWPGYCGMVKRCDEALGRVLDALRSLSALEDTVVLFTSDHGCHFKTRNAEYKRSCHDASIRVPTAFYGGEFTGGGTLTQLASLVDLPATLLDVAGISVPAHFVGRSLLSLVRRSAVDWPDDVFVQISESQTGRAIRTARWKYCAILDRKDANGNWVSQPGAEVYADYCLYDLSADPWELTNLIGMAPYADVVREMRERLTRRMIAADEPAPKFTDAPAVPFFQRQPEYHGGSRVT
jgi:arylsulfatase A-like enzyme